MIGKVEGTNLEVLRDFADEALEGELADEQLGRLLVATDFTEGDGTRPEAMGLLDTACCIDGLHNEGELECQRQERRGYERSYERPWRQVAYEVPYHRWTCGRFA